MRFWRAGGGGAAVRTEYDKPGDPPSRDCTMMWVVEEPFAEPRIHRAFPGGLEDLEIYRQEVVDGIHDHWIAPEEGKWTYTYHKRLFAYETEGAVIDQIESLVEKLSRSGHSRRAQAITWNVALDPPTNDPPCLQRVWCRLLPGDGGSFVLNMNTHWRSRDGFKAAYMNVFALTELQKIDRRPDRRTVRKGNPPWTLRGCGRQLSHLRLLFPGLRGIPQAYRKEKLRRADLGFDLRRADVCRDEGKAPEGKSGQALSRLRPGRRMNEPAPGGRKLLTGPGLPGKRLRQNLRSGKEMFIAPLEGTISFVRFQNP